MIESTQSTPGGEQVKDRLLTQHAPAMVASVAEAVVLKAGDLYFLCEPDGEVPFEGPHGLGLYYRDCRFLGAYALRVGGRRLHPLAASSVEGFRALIQLTNGETLESNQGVVDKQTIVVGWERILDADRLALVERLTFHNFGHHEVSLSAALSFDARFEDIFNIRGLIEERPGELRRPTWGNDALVFAYLGKDGQERRTIVQVHGATVERDGAHLDMQLGRGQERTFELTVQVEQRRPEEPSRIQPLGPAQRSDGEAQQRAEAWLSRFARIESDSAILDRALDRSLRDLRALESTLDGRRYFAAGVPWFVTLFGRDSALTCLETLAWNPHVAEDTLMLLARYQGQREDAWRDEEPGKVLHELRTGELARAGLVPHTPYYGTVDATPLFLILLARHASWTGSLELFQLLEAPVEAALGWMDRYGDHGGEGYIAYHSRTEHGLTNQGWKDSGDAIVGDDGQLAEPPIALCEVQGYAYLARRLMADLYERAGRPARADALRRAAEHLRARFDRDFWMVHRRFLALALARGWRPVEVFSSNAGQALWSGIVEPARAGALVSGLMADDMFSGWGIRTLSSRERAYNPVGYHLGTVWPHDNALIAAGFRRYGFDQEACRVFRGLLAAASHFEHFRLPEVFSGLPRQGYGIPVRYPVACHPQAWAAGALPYLVESLVGLEPDAFDRTLRVVRPLLPKGVHWLRLRGLRVADAEVDLELERSRSDFPAVRVTRREGDVRVVVELA